MLIHPLCVVGHWQYCGNIWLWPWGLWRWNSYVFIYFYPRQIYDPGWWQKKLDQSQNCTKHYCTLFICLLYIRNVSSNRLYGRLYNRLQSVTDFEGERLWRSKRRQRRIYMYCSSPPRCCCCCCCASSRCHGIRVMSWWQLVARYSVTVLHCVQRLVVIFSSLK